MSSSLQKEWVCSLPSAICLSLHRVGGKTPFFGKKTTLHQSICWLGMLVQRKKLAPSVLTAGTFSAYVDVCLHGHHKRIRRDPEHVGHQRTKSSSGCYAPRLLCGHPLCWSTHVYFSWRKQYVPCPAIAIVPRSRKPVVIRDTLILALCPGHWCQCAPYVWI